VKLEPTFWYFLSRFLHKFAASGYLYFASQYICHALWCLVVHRLLVIRIVDLQLPCIYTKTVVIHRGFQVRTCWIPFGRRAVIDEVWSFNCPNVNIILTLYQAFENSHNYGFKLITDPYGRRRSSILVQTVTNCFMIIYLWVRWFTGLTDFPELFHRPD
jgi:hypothetical protein